MGRFMIFCCGLLSVVMLGATAHIYPTYPTNATADQLVCINRACTSDEECVTSYEVCSENPVYENETVVRFTCHALFFVNSNTSFTSTSQQCLNDPHSPCPVNCTLNSHPFSDTTTLHECCCTGNLCNDVKLELNGTDENNDDTSSTVISTPTMTLPNAATMAMPDATTAIPSATRSLLNATTTTAILSTTRSLLNATTTTAIPSTTRSLLNATTTTAIPSTTRSLLDATITTIPSATTELPNDTTEVPNTTTSLLTPTALPPTVTTMLPTSTPGPTNVNTHIYSTYPTHVAPGELVCVYRNCEYGDCDTQYEVCSENPAFKDVSTVQYTCVALLSENADTGNTTTSQHCLYDSESTCPTKCTPTFKRGPAKISLYDCCCVGDLCNNVTFNVSALQSTSSIVNHVTTTHNPGPDSTVRASSDDEDDVDDDDYVPLIYGIAAGMCLLIALTLVVILTLGYFHYYHDKRVNCRKCISYNHFGS